MEYKFNDEMRLEYVNENQIRCILTKNILQERKLKLFELAKGTEKAKKMFREIMQRAETFLHFYAEDIPILLECIPLNENAIVLIITKTEDFAEPLNQQGV